MDYLKSVGDRIRSRRKELNITQDALAQMTGYTSRSSINKIEKGLVDIPQSKITEIADALLVTPAYLMGWEEDNSPTPDQLFEKFEQLTEDDQRWLELGRRISPSTKEVAYPMIEKFDNLSEERKMIALIRILDALGHQ